MMAGEDPPKEGAKMAKIATGFCNVCNHPIEKPVIRKNLAYLIDCPRCGTYVLPDACELILGDPTRGAGLLASDLQKASVGHWLRQRQKVEREPALTLVVLQKLAQDPWLPSLHDQRENLLLLLGDRSSGPGERIVLDALIDQYQVGSRNSDTIGAIVDRLEAEGLTTGRGKLGAGTEFWIELTFQSALALEDLRRGKTSGRTAFMAMPFNKSDLDNTWLPQLRTAVEATGFSLKRVDDEPQPGIIDIRMRLQIQRARFLIVELTHANLGAYWEAGYAEGLGKPVIYTCCEGHVAHFDVDHSLRIMWDPRNLLPALERIKATIRNALPDATPERET